MTGGARTPPVAADSSADAVSILCRLRRGRKVDWDRVEAEVKKEEKAEKPEGEQALQKLFREIYSGADEDTRRAMNKSFQVTSDACSGSGIRHDPSSGTCWCETKIILIMLSFLVPRPDPDSPPCLSVL